MYSMLSLSAQETVLKSACLHVSISDGCQKQSGANSNSHLLGVV